MYILYKPTSQKEVKHPFNYENRSAILPIKQSYPFEMKKKKKKKKKKKTYHLSSQEEKFG